MGDWMICVRGTGPIESVRKKLATFVTELKKDCTDVDTDHVHGSWVLSYAEPKVKFYLNGKERYVDLNVMLTYSDLVKMSNVLPTAVGSVEMTMKTGPIYRLKPNEAMTPYEGQVVSVLYRE